jgi:proline dehydrogenase
LRIFAGYIPYCTELTCSGETREEAVRLGKELQAEGISPLLVYSKESSDSPEDIHHTEVEITKCIQATKALSRPVFVAIKLSGLSPDEELRLLERDIHSLVSKVTSHSTPRFSAEAVAVLSRYADLTGRLQRLANVARQCDVELVLDAEVRFQDEVDSLPTSAILCSMLNSAGSHVWNTHQMYVSRRPLLTYRIFKDSIQKLDQWSGNNPIKLVRGAYLHEEPPNRVIQSKQEADNMYDNAVRDIMINRTNAVMLATHNHRSVVKACQLLGHLQPAHKSPRIISFAQLYGMGDDISYGLVEKMKTLSVPSGIRISVVKYIPYGGLNEVLPYLVRRAEENRGMLGGSMLEREALYFELKRRVLKSFGVGSSI